MCVWHSVLLQRARDQIKIGRTWSRKQNLGHVTYFRMSFSAQVRSRERIEKIMELVCLICASKTSVGDLFISLLLEEYLQSNQSTFFFHWLKEKTRKEKMHEQPNKNISM